MIEPSPAASPWRTARWWGITVLALVGVLACAALGAWQYDRARTRDTPTGPTDPMAATPVALAEALSADGRVPPGSDPVGVTVTGRYDAAHTFLVPGRTIDGQSVGFAVTPLLRADAPAVLVVRGAVQDRPDGFGMETAPPPTGEVTVTGWLVPPEPLEAGSVDQLALPSNQLATVTPARALAALGYPLVDGYVGLVQEVRDGKVLEPSVQHVPVPLVQSGVRWSVQSLSYAIEWWFFALAGVWMWVQALRIERRRSAEESVAQSVTEGQAVPRPDQPAEAVPPTG